MFPYHSSFMIPRASSEYEFEFSGQISIRKRGGPLLTYGGFSQCHNVPVDAGPERRCSPYDNLLLVSWPIRDIIMCITGLNPRLLGGSAINSVLLCSPMIWCLRHATLDLVHYKSSHNLYSMKDTRKYEAWIDNGLLFIVAISCELLWILAE